MYLYRKSSTRKALPIFSLNFGELMLRLLPLQPKLESRQPIFKSQYLTPRHRPPLPHRCLQKHLQPREGLPPSKELRDPAMKKVTKERLRWTKMKVTSQWKPRPMRINIRSKRGAVCVFLHSRKCWLPGQIETSEQAAFFNFMESLSL